jgi:glycosyltransferase involved in cell wall biosynthesis
MAGPDGVGLQPELAALAQRLGISERVTWTGMLEGAAKWGALRAADVFVLPSHQENFGIAVAEALAMGLPTLLSTQVNIWREVVAAGAGLAEPDTLAGTVALLSRWLALPAVTRTHMRQAATPCFERHFHVQAAAQRLLALVAAGRSP